jgi:hypothetical protein
MITRTKDLHKLPSEFYLFSYGANSPKNLERRFEVDEDIIKSQTYTAFLPGYVRSFFGYSKAWEGSVGTLIKVPLNKYGTWGLLTFIKKVDSKFMIDEHEINFEQLALVEGLNEDMYQLKRLDNLCLIEKEKFEYPIYAFIGCYNRYKNNILPS